MSDRVCLTCGTDISERGQLARYCKPCVRKKVRKYNQSPMGRYRSFVSCHIKKGVIVELSFEQYQELKLQECYFCSQPSSSLRRFNKNIGYTIENTLPVCPKCQVARWQQTPEEFIAYAKAIVDRHSKT